MVAILLTLPTCWVLLQDTIWHWLLWPSCLIGAASALGWVYVPLSKNTFRALSIVATILGGQYYLLRTLYDTQDPAMQVLGIVGFLGICMLGIILLAHGQRRICRDITTSRPTPQLHLTMLSTRWWMIKKLFRSSVAGTGFWVTLCVSSLMVLVMRQLHVTDSHFTAGMIALLTAAQASDIRRSSKKIAPVEIIGLKATGYFMVKEYLAALLLCTVAISPMLISFIWLLSHTPFSSVISAHAAISLIGSNLLLGVSAGLWSGTQFTSQTKDISAQCCSVFAALVIIAAPQLPWFSGVTITQQVYMQFGLAVLLLALCAAIEYQRNSYIWRR